MRWSRARRPGDVGRPAPPREPVSIAARVAKINPKALYSGEGARSCIAPDTLWDGPFRIHRPEGFIGPAEKVVGLSVKRDPRTKPLRTALERQYRAASAGYARR